MATLAERLKSLRAEKGITQEQLAQISELDRITINRYENGVAEDPSLGTLKKWSKYFDVTIEFISGNTDIRDRNVNTNTINTIFNMLNDARKIQLVSYAKFL